MLQHPAAAKGSWFAVTCIAKAIFVCTGVSRFRSTKFTGLIAAVG